MKKLFSILLLVLVWLPLGAPLLALGTDGDTSLPMCCRRDGTHHCMGNMAMPASGDQAGGGMRISAPRPRCPFCPQTAASVHAAVARPGTACAIFAGLVSHPCGVAQVRSRWRIARERSRGKRGPPPTFFG